MIGVGPLTRWLIVWPVAHPRGAVAVVLVLSVLAGWSVTRIRPDASLAAMFPRHDPAAEALVRVLDDFPAADQLIVLASLPEDSSDPDPDRLTAFATRFEDEVRRSFELSQLTSGVSWHADEESRAFVEQVIGPAALFYLDDAAYAAARQRLSTQQIHQKIAQDKALLSTPGPAAQAFSRVMRVDPLGLHEFITQRLGAQRPFRTYRSGNAFISPDGRTLLVRVPGRRPPSDLDFCRALVAGIQSAAWRANADGLKLEYAGSYAIAAESARAIRRDMIESVIGSVVLLQLLFVVAYRSPFTMFLLAFGPVAAGILLGFGAYAWASPGLTPLTAVLGAILAGMGIDYSIQYLSYYESRRTAGRYPRDAVEETALRMSPAIFAAWFTSIVGFLAIGWSSVKALTDFAILGTLGLLGAFLCGVLLLPGLLLLSDRRSTPLARTRLRFGVSRLVHGIGRFRNAALSFTILFLIASIAIAFHGGDLLPMESDLTVMHPRPNPAIEAQNHVSERFGISAGQLVVYLRAAPEELVSLAYRINDRLSSRACVSAGVSGTYGLATLLPHPGVAQRRAQAFTDAEAQRVVSDFRSSLAQNDFMAEPFEDYAKFLRGALTRRDVPGIADLVRYRTLAETVLPASALNGAPPQEAVSLVFVDRSLDERANRDAAVEAVRQALHGLSGATVTGLGVVGHDTEQTVRRELPKLVLIALAILAAYHTLHFRNAADALLSLVPMLFGIVTLAALMRVTGNRLNMVNLVAVPLLIGIDVDYGIFVVNLARVRAIRDMTPGELASHIEPATHAVLICATATFLGFGSLLWTSVPAERSLGVAAATGIVTCMTAVLFILVPVFFSLARRR